MNILLADDHPLFCDSLQTALQRIFPDCNVVRSDTWQDTIVYVDKIFFDLILLDLIMPGVDGYQWELNLAKIMENEHGSVCVISALTGEDHVKRALRMGVQGYIYKTFTFEQIQNILQLVRAGSRYFPPSVTWSVEKNDTDRIITRRQQEILELLADGCSNKEIADRLSLSESTVKRHISNLYRAINAKNRADAVRIGQQKKLLG